MRAISDKKEILIYVFILFNFKFSFKGKLQKTKDTKIEQLGIGIT
jgi:hypothetical protein